MSCSLAMFEALYADTIRDVDLNVADEDGSAQGGDRCLLPY